MAKYKKYLSKDDIEVANDAPIWSKRIALELCNQHMSQDELAKKSCVSAPTINAWIRGAKENGVIRYTEPRIKNFNNVAKALGVSIDYLIGNI